MQKETFDFGAMLDSQFRGIRKGYKFGKSFNDDKSLVRPEKPVTVAGSGDDVAIKAAFEAGEAISGLVEKEVKGGYEVTVVGNVPPRSNPKGPRGGVRAFCPFSQIDKTKRESAEYLGRKFDFIVTEYSVDDRGLNVVVSRRALLDVQEAALREALLAELTEGETLNGTVTRVLDFGAFVDLGGVEGLVPAREVAWERVEDLNAVLKAGDAVTVKILHIDREAGKLTLSRRECMARVFRKSPEDEAAAKSAAEVAAWMDENRQRNAAFGMGAFDSL